MSLVRILCVVCVAALVGSARAAETGAKKTDTGSDAQMEADKKALSPVVQYVGEWRGTGLPKGAAAVREGWSEETEWQYDLKGGHAALTFSATKGKYYKAGRIEPGAKAGTFKFIGTLPDDKKEELTGEFNKEKDLVFENPAPGDGRPAKIEFSMVAKGARMLMNFYKKSPGGRYENYLEMGYTRKGSGFGQNANANECIITGGVGKIQVSYKGQTYWVCCGGCKEAFETNPEKEIAAYKKRKEEEKKNK